MERPYSYTIGNGRSATMSGAKTLPEAVEKMAWYRAYYLENGSGPAWDAVEWNLICEACDGNGRIAGKRPRRGFPAYKDCKACGARGSFPLPVVG